MIYLADGRTESAIACFKLAIETSPSYYEKASANLQLASSALDASDQGGQDSWAMRERVEHTCP